MFTNDGILNQNRCFFDVNSGSVDENCEKVTS